MSTSIDLAARLSAIVDIQQAVLGTLSDIEKAMGLVVERVPEVTNATGAVIEIVDGEDLVYRAASGSAAGHVGMRLARSSSLSGEAVRTSSVIRSDDCDLDPRVDGVACRAIGIRSMVIAPLLQGEMAVGALKAFSARPNAFDDLDAYALQLLAGMTSAALMQAGEFAQRQASEKRYRLLFDKNVAGVFRTTLDGRILDCNDALVTYLGYSSRDELMGRASWELYQQRSDRETLIEHLKHDHALTNLRLHLKKKDGTPMTAVVNVSLIPADGGETQLLGTVVEEG